jgi:glucose-6-phosphate-specific signal transduction histidine kinase
VTLDDPDADDGQRREAHEDDRGDEHDHLDRDEHPPDDAAVGRRVGLRIVQEALSNVLRHAPGSAARVEVEHAPAAVTVVVEDDGAGSRPAEDGAVQGTPRQRIGGHGLVGVRERVAVHGGILEAGPASPGFRVRASFPLTRRWS